MLATVGLPPMAEPLPPSMSATASLALPIPERLSRHQQQEISALIHEMNFQRSDAAVSDLRQQSAWHGQRIPAWDELFADLPHAEFRLVSVLPVSSFLPTVGDIAQLRALDNCTLPESLHWTIVVDGDQNRWQHLLRAMPNSPQCRGVVIDHQRQLAAAWLPAAASLPPITVLVDGAGIVVASFVGQRDEQRPSKDLILRWLDQLEAAPTAAN